MSNLVLPNLPVVIPAGVLDYRPVSDITPFTHRAGMTYQALLEVLREYSTEYLPDYLMTNFAGIQGSWQDNLDALQAAVNTALAAQATTVATNLAATLAQIVAGANSTLNDSNILSALQLAGSTARAYLDGRYAAAATTVTANRVRDRYAEHVFNVKDYGAVGNGTNDDTVAVQAAVTAALGASDPANVEIPLYNGKSPVVFFPLGTYSVNQIEIPGSIVLRGVGGAIYAASELLQRTTGQHILHCTADTDNQSQASVFEDLTFKSASGTSSQVAQVMLDASAANSAYFRRCWFKSPEKWGIWHRRGDDLKVIDCTFDVSAFDGIRLGDRANNMQVTNAGISNNTFFGIALRTIFADNVHGLVLGDNRAYNPGTNSVWIEATNFENMSSKGNTLDGYDRLYKLYGGQVASFDDTAYNVKSGPFYIGGGQVLYGLDIKGIYHGTTAGWPHGAVWAEATGLQVSKSSAVYFPGATSPLMFDMSDARVTGNRFTPTQNVGIRFTADNNFTNAAANGA